MRLPVDVAEEDRGVRLAVVVHEHQLLTKLVLEIPEIAPRPLLNRRYRRRMVIGQAHQLIVVHATRTMTGAAAEARTVLPLPEGAQRPSPLRLAATPLGSATTVAHPTPPSGTDTGARGTTKWSTSRGRTDGQRRPPPPGGSIFDRRKGVNFRPALTSDSDVHQGLRERTGKGASVSNHWGAVLAGNSVLLGLG
jgi:hypothetical protein